MEVSRIIASHSNIADTISLIQTSRTRTTQQLSLGNLDQFSSIVLLWETRRTRYDEKWNPLPVLPILLNFPISWWQSANLDQKSYSRILDQSVELTLLIALIAASFDAPTVDVIFAGREMVGFCVPFVYT